MKFRDSDFSPPPGHDDPDRHNRICRTSMEHISTSSVNGTASGYSEDDRRSPRRLGRTSGMESDRTGRIRRNSQIRQEDSAKRISPHLLKQRRMSALRQRVDLDSIRRKIASGYYDTPGHLEELADVLMEKIDLLGPDQNHDDFDINPE
jgi:hypothetical protein